MNKAVRTLSDTNRNRSEKEQQGKNHSEMLIERFKIQHQLSKKSSVVLDDVRSGRGFGRYIRAARVSRDMTVGELANKTGIPQKTLEMIEGGFWVIQQIENEWVYRLAAVLEEDVERLYLLLGLPVQPRSPQGVLDKVRCYLNDGWLGSRSRYRSQREPRDPERLYFDK